jgi:uncharacterized phiE125 gp8 family phage protein
VSGIELERRLFLVTAPVDEPIDIDAAKWQLRAEHIEDDDEWLQNEGIPAARERAEHGTGRQLITAIYDLKLDGFPCGRWIEVPRPPLQSVTYVKYLDASGVEQTFADTNYRVSKPTGPRCARGRIALVSDVSWPTTADEIESVTVRFVAGYGDSGVSVPAQLRMAMLRDIGALHSNREQVIVKPGLTMPVELPDGSKRVYKTFKSYPRR